MRIPRLLPAALLATLLPLAAVAQTRLDNAHIITIDAAMPYARSMVFDAAGRILAVGDTTELAQRWPDAARVDAGGRTVVPGLIDAHGHVLGLGQSLMVANLIGATSKAQIIERLKAFERELPEDAWLLGRGWDQNRWAEKQFPTAGDLDAAFPDRPVWLDRVDGHAGWANSAALAYATRDLSGDWQPDGGRIERTQGKATGVLVDAAAGLIESALPKPAPELIAVQLRKAMAALSAVGINGVHDAGVSLQTLGVYRALADAGHLSLRVYAMADGDGAALEALCRDGLVSHAGGYLQMRALKLYSDGALGSRGALLAADYSDDAGNRGLPVTAEAALESAARKAKACGVQVATHAIGDGGNRTVLDVYQRVFGDDAKADHRWRIEHAQIVALRDIPRFHALGVIASMQPTHATSDMPWAEKRVGQLRIVGGYAWRKFRDADVRLALGSDFPVEEIDPIMGLYAATTRQDAAGMPGGGWYANERLTPFEALRGFTLDAAFAGFDEQRLGSLSVGKRADFVVLSADPIAASPAALRKTRVLETWVDGKRVYRAL